MVKRGYSHHYAHIRDIARRTYNKSNKPKECIHCGYDKHYEVAHIKAIKDHPKDSKISEVNHIDNLIALCPNCHWELDYGDLDIVDVITSVRD